jgi:hypothetical protein
VAHKQALVNGRQKNVHSNVEPEFHDIAVFHQILLSFDPQFPGFSTFRERTKLNEVVEVNCFRGNKSALKIRMDNPGGGRSFIAFLFLRS